MSSSVLRIATYLRLLNTLSTDAVAKMMSGLIEKHKLLLLLSIHTSNIYLIKKNFTAQIFSIFSGISIAKLDQNKF
jgi:hypothetical protein